MRLKDAAQADPRRWPLLALSPHAHTRSTHPEWVYHTKTHQHTCTYGDCDHGHSLNKPDFGFNYTQVFMDYDLNRLLDNIEHALMWGRRTGFNSSTVGPTLGGWEELTQGLNRPRKQDLFVIRVLRDLFSREDNHMLPSNPRHKQWVTDISLEARRAD